MPIYEYACLECGHEFEKIQKMSDASARKCPSCGRLKARRQISRSSFVLKGGGWYVTDYPSKDREAAMKAESDGKPKTTDKTTDKATETAAAPSSGQAGNGTKGSSKKPKASKSESSKSKAKSE